MTRLDKESNRAFYDTERPAERERFAREPSKLHTAELLVPWVVSSLEPGARVLDVAGGSGTYASELVRAAPMTVVGVDISESMVRQRGQDALLPDNVVGDMEALPFASGIFDALLFVASLHHVPDPLPALREARRVLRPGGRLFALEPCSIRAWREGRRAVPGMPHEFSVSVFWLAEQIRAAGFVVEDVASRNLSIRPLSVFARTPSLRLFRLADTIDRPLAAVPGLRRLGSTGMFKAVTPA